MVYENGGIVNPLISIIIKINSKLKRIYEERKNDFQRIENGSSCVGWFFGLAQISPEANRMN